MPRPRLVLVSTAVAYDGVPHAGGQYLLSLYRLLGTETELTVISPGTRTNREAATRSGAPEGLLLLGLAPGGTLLDRVLNRLSLRLDIVIRRLDPGGPYLPLLVGLMRSPEARRAVREADVIDLQWTDSIRLVGLLRRLNPRARYVGTFHDVQSQLFAREPSRWTGDGTYWRVVGLRSRRLERRMVRRLDRVIVFSAKDADLLGNPPWVTVVAPPLGSDSLPHEPPGAPVVLVVSYLARDENDKAAQWLLREIWPRVRAACPAARLRLVGAGATAAVQDLVAADASASLPGYVADLDPEYAAATVCVVALRQGAGVKFKTVEAMLHGVPTVSTTVGSEGIERADLLAAQVDDAEAIGDALIAVLREPERWQPQGDAAQEWAAATYTSDAFTAAIRSSWVG